MTPSIRPDGNRRRRAIADLRLGIAFSAQGERLRGRRDKLAKPALDKAAKWLTSVHEELPAFGPDHAVEARLCVEQKELAERLLASLRT